MTRTIRARRSVARLAMSGLAAAGLVSVFANPAGAGYGGVQAIQYGDTAWFAGRTGPQLYNDWFSPSWSTCTHAYPYNDLYRNNVPSFTTFDWLYFDASTNCNRVVLYTNTTQGGGGAVNCYRDQAVNYQCGPFVGKTFYSISWHNR